MDITVKPQPATHTPPNLRGSAAVRAIFDAAYYLRANPDVAAAGADPLQHFLYTGWAEGRKPHPLFDTDYYIDSNADIAQAGINPLIHYVASGAREGRNPSPLFHSAWYRDTHADVGDSNPLAHYIHVGAFARRNPNPLFDADWYVRKYPDSAANPLAHYVEHGARTQPHPLFDPEYYLAQNPDVAEAGIDPFAHYLLRGHLERRRPHADFDAVWYLKEYPDVAAAGMNPLLHYVLAGKNEGRETKAAMVKVAASQLAPAPASGAAAPSAPRPNSIVEPRRDKNGHARFPRYRVGDGRRLATHRVDRDHHWYEGPVVEEFLNQIDGPQLSRIARLLVIGHDFGLKTGVMRSMSHYLNALVAAGGVELTSIELARDADAMVALHDAEVADFFIVNSLPIFFDHKNGAALLRKAGLGKCAVYLHETDFVFDRLLREKPQEYAAFAELAPSLHFLTVSQQQEEMLQRRFGATHTHRVYEVSPIAVAKAAPKPAGSERTIVMVGTLQARKGLELFSQTADLAHKLGLPWKFRWAGGEVGLSKGLYRSPHVEFVGDLDEASLHDFLNRADVLFLSSRDDPFPLACLEALQLRKRLVVFSGTGTSEVIRNLGGCAIYDQHTPDAALQALRQAVSAPIDTAAYDQLNQRFSLSAFVRRMNSEIEKILAPRARPPIPAHQTKIAAIVHLFYHDLWHEIRAHLENVRHLDIDLYVTLTDEKSAEELRKMGNIIRRSWPNAHVLVVPNRGMDIGPFTEVCRKISSQKSRRYDLVLKLHSKKSIEASGVEKGTAWRRELLEGLVGSRSDVERVISIFADHGDIGMIGAKGMLISKSTNDVRAGTDTNAQNMKILADRLELNNREQLFFRGTMFWARASAVIDPINSANLSASDFEEGHQPDNSKGHAMERLFACMVRDRGMRLFEYDRELPKPISLLKNRHRGEDIYIVAAGASGEHIDPRFFEGKTVIGVNRVFVKFPCTYVMFKEFGGADYEAEMLERRVVPVVAQWDSGNLRRGKMRKNTALFRRPEYYFFEHLENTLDVMDLDVVSPDSNRLVVSHSTITSAIQFAAYLGAKNIILLGHDCGTLDGKAVFDGYYKDMSISPWKSMDEYKAWLDQIEGQTITVRNKVLSTFDVHSISSINPFVNFGLEGHEYRRGQ